MGLWPTSITCALSALETRDWHQCSGQWVYLHLTLPTTVHERHSWCKQTLVNQNWTLAEGL